MPGIEATQRFPFINLEKAVDRAKQLYEADQRGGEMSTAGAFAVWSYSAKSSGGHQTIAALKSYGMLEGESGKLKLTKKALDYFRDEREDAKEALLGEFAMTPPLLRSLWNQWRGHPPADTLARTHLKVDRGINEQSARAVLGIYKDNLAYANLKGDAKLPELSDATGGDSTTPPKVGIGDYVQWTSRGMDQFDSPRKVTWISEDFSHLRVHGSTTGIPMTEVVVAAAPKPKAERESLPGHASSSETSDREGKRDISVLLLPSGHLEITATVDAEGLKKLKQMLDKYTEILEMLQ